MKKIKTKDLYKNLINVWHYAKEQKLMFGIIFACSLLITVTFALTPIFYSHQIAEVSKNLLDELLMTSVLLLVVENLSMILRFVIKTYATRFTNKLVISLQRSLLINTLDLSIDEIDKHSSGKFIDRINYDTNDIASSFIELSENIMGFVSRLVITIGIFFVSKIIFTFCLIVLALFFITEYRRAKIIDKLEKEKREIKELNSGLVGELVRGVRDIKLLNIKDSFLTKTISKLDSTLFKEREISLKRRNYDTLNWYLEDMGYFILTLIMIYLIKENNLTISAAVLLYYYYFRIIGLVPFYTAVVDNLRKFNLAGNRIFEIINKLDKESFGNLVLTKPKGDIEFKGVWFGYNNTNVIKGLDLKIKRNQTIALVGKSGSGKTTIFNLITKMYDVLQGEILIDGTNINDLTEESIRNNITVVTQNPYIFNFTIKENLKMVNPSISDQALYNACKKACLHDYVMSLPDGYDTLIGEGGLKLSGGQRQRLAIARGLIKKSPIILFDEATSALDNETQAMISKAIKNLKHKCTVLIIAHRLSTVKNSDRIILIDEGKIVGNDKHEVLLNSNKFYQNLYQEDLK